MKGTRRCVLYLSIAILPLFFVVVSSLSEAHIKNKMPPPLTSQMRVELFFKNAADLRERVKFLQSYGISKFNLVNKNKADPMEEWVDGIREVYPDANVCAHYSLKYNKIPRKGIEDQEQRFLEMMSTTRANEVLIVSGSGPKTMWNTVQVLKTFQNAESLTTTAQLAVAYNPYFPNPKDQEEEDNRLKEKLASGCVNKIYLQFGSDLQSLKRGLQFCQSTATECSPDNDISIAGSLFLPTAKLIAQQKFRPWNGVFLSPEFLSGPDDASSILIEMMKIYQNYNVEFLWEAPGIRTEKDMDLLIELVAKIENECVSKTAETDQASTAENNDRGRKRLKTDVAIEKKKVVRTTPAFLFLVPTTYDYRIIVHWKKPVEITSLYYPYFSGRMRNERINGVFVVRLKSC